MSEEKFRRLIDLRAQQGDEEGRLRALQGLKAFRASQAGASTPEAQPVRQDIPQSFDPGPTFADTPGQNAIRGIKDAGMRLFGGLEFGTQIVSSGPASVIAGLGGIAGEVAGQFQGLEGVGADTAKRLTKMLTYEPRSQEAKDIIKFIEPAIRAAQSYIQGEGEGVQEGVEVLFGPTAGKIAGTAVETLPAAAAEYFGLRGLRSLKSASQAERTARETISPPEQARTFDETGIVATKGEFEHSKGLEEAFGQLKKEGIILEQSSPAGDQLRGFKKRQSEEVRDYLEGVSPGESALLATKIKGAIELRKSSAKFARREAYKELAEATKDTNVQLGIEPLINALPDAGRLADFSATRSGQSSALSGLLAEFGVDNSGAAISYLKANKIDVRPLSVANTESFRQRLKDIEDSDVDGYTGRFTGPIRKALDEEFDLASAQLELNGSESVSRAAKNARLSNVALKTEFDEAGLVDKLIATKSRRSRVPKVENSEVYSTLAAKSTKVEQFQNVVNSLDRAASKGRQAKNELKSRFVLDLVDSAFGARTRKIQGERMFGGGAFAKRYDDLEPKIKVLFSPDEVKKLAALKKNAEDLTYPGGATIKGSAGFFADALEKMGVWSIAAANKFPIVGPVFVSEVKRIVSQSKAEAAVRSATETGKSVRALLETDYPSLAAALALGAKVDTETDTEEEAE